MTIRRATSAFAHIRVANATCVICVICVICGICGICGIAAAQPAPAKAPGRVEIVAAARAVIAAARYATFVTLDASGQPQARVVDAFSPEEDLTIWIGTKAASRKVAQVAANERVTLLYFDPAGQNYVTVIGTATLVRDAQEKATHWKEAWAGFYKDKNRGDDYVLIRVTPRRLEVVAVALGMTSDPATWRPVILDLQAR
jgi:general stress protein 26